MIDKRKIPIVQIAYTSEWALGRFFAALKEKEIDEEFYLEGICGREKDARGAAYRLGKSILDKWKFMAENPDFRPANRIKEVESSSDLMLHLGFDGLKYFEVNGVKSNCSLPPKAYECCEAVVIHSNNTTHVGYIGDAVINEKHVLCEKPLIPVLDELGNPTDEDIKTLEAIVDGAEGLVLMDAEHYSYKESSQIFYQNLEKIMKGRKITNVRGEIKEIDNPDYWRTQEILNPNNRTGLLADTMCHLLAFISNLGGKSTPTLRQWDSFKNDVEYKVDTQDRVNYKIDNIGSNSYFADGAEASLEVAKFINMSKEAEGAKKAGDDKKVKESKFIEFTFDDGANLRIDFKTGEVVEVSKEGTRKMYTADPSKRAISSNEYVNIMNEFYDSIINKREPLTNFRNSVVTMKAIYETYKLTGDKNIHGGFYYEDSRVELSVV